MVMKKYSSVSYLEDARMPRLGPAKDEILEAPGPRPVMRPTGIRSNILIPTSAQGDKYTFRNGK